jgi:cobalt-zinc-cadmium efflux system membrane fusion protein
MIVPFHRAPRPESRPLLPYASVWPRPVAAYVDPAPWRLTALLGALLLLVACGGAAKETAASGEDAPPAAALADTPHLPPGVRTGQARRRLMAEPLACRGTVDVPPGYHATVHAPVTAFVRGLDVLPGSRVRAGQRVATLAHPDLVRLQEDYLAARAERAYQRRTRERRDGLDSTGALSARVTDRDAADLERAEARYQSLDRQLRLAGLDPEAVSSGGIVAEVPLRAPIGGYVSRVFLNRGALAGDASPVLEIVDDSHRHLELTVYPADLHRVSPDQAVRYRLSGSEAWHEAEVHLINTQLDERTQGVQVHAHLREPAPPLAIGAVVQAEILGRADSAWAVPESALGGSAVEPLLWVLDANGHAHAEAVRTGRRLDGWVELLDPGPLARANLVLDGAARMGGEGEARDHGH